MELDYRHFTVHMHPTRRRASWVAWNIDGLRLFPSDSISRSGENFRADPAFPTTAQTLNDAYRDNASTAATSPADQTSSGEPSSTRE